LFFFNKLARFFEPTLQLKAARSLFIYDAAMLCITVSNASRLSTPRLANRPRRKQAAQRLPAVTELAFDIAVELRGCLAQGR
jgi:hypothetical protein